ncbi:hypothetical protein Tco_0983168 [Tanacetum coccineum]
MYVHNFVHNSVHNYDDEYEPDLAVTLISKLDLSHALHLHHIDYDALAVVSVKHKGTENYQVWSCDMLLSLEGSSIVDYYHKLNALWKQFDALVELPRCICHAANDFKKHNQLMKLMQFLIGLDDTYMQIRSFILSRETLHDVRSAYAIISNEESQRITFGNIAETSHKSQTSAFTANVPDRGNYEISNL